jgi:4-hydroxy-tetrahydrodipicolinate reductase
MKIRVILAGATGWVGSCLAKEISKTDDIEIVGAIAADHLGENLGKALNIPDLNVRISSLSETLQVAGDVFVDFTKPDDVKNNVIAAINHKLSIVVGTSGLSDQDYSEINALAKHKNIGVIAAGNYSITAAIMQHFATIAAQHIPSWEIIDFASEQKPDAPSGTARELAYRLAEIRKPQVKLSIDQTLGNKEARGATLNETQVHSVRLPGYTLSTEVIFGMPDEKLIMRHEAGDSAVPYIAGILLAIRNVKKYSGLVRGLDRVLAV